MKGSKRKPRLGITKFGADFVIRNTLVLTPKLWAALNDIAERNDMDPNMVLNAIVTRHLVAVVEREEALSALAAQEEADALLYHEAAVYEELGKASKLVS